MLGNVMNSNEKDLMTTISKSELAELRAKLSAVHKYQSAAEYTLSGKILSVNEGFTNLTGYSAGDLIDQEIGMLLDLQYRHSVDNLIFWKKLNNGESISGTFKRIGKGFKTIWIHATYFAILDLTGKPFKVVEHATDITEHMQLKQALTKTVHEIHAVVLAVKNNDLSQQVSLQGKQGEISDLCKDMNSMVDCMKAIIGMVNKTSASIISAAQRVNVTSKALITRS
jgi:methyl-accepting chemotaxis protein